MLTLEMNFHARMRREERKKPQEPKPRKPKSRRPRKRSRAGPGSLGHWICGMPAERWKNAGGRAGRLFLSDTALLLCIIYIYLKLQGVSNGGPLVV